MVDTLPAKIRFEESVRALFADGVGGRWGRFCVVYVDASAEYAGLVGRHMAAAWNAHAPLVTIATEARDIMRTFSGEDGDDADEFAARIEAVLNSIAGASPAQDGSAEADAAEPSKLDPAQAQLLRQLVRGPVTTNHSTTLTSAFDLVRLGLVHQPGHGTFALTVAGAHALRGVA